MRALWLKDRPWMLAMFVIGAIAMALAVADDGFVDVFVLAPYRLEACFYVAGAAGLLLGAVAVLWDHLLGTREFLTQRPIGKRALAWSPLLACMVVLLAWQLVVPVLSWLLASIYSGLFEPSFWTGVPEILTTTAIAWPACAIGCLAASLPAPWWIRLLLAGTLTLSVGVAIDLGHARDEDGCASLLGYWLLCLLPAAALFAIAANLGTQQNDADQPCMPRARWLGGLLLLFSVSLTCAGLCRKAQQHAIHQAQGSYPRIVEFDGQVQLAAFNRERDAWRVCGADHVPVSTERSREVLRIVDYRKPTSGSVRLEIEPPRFNASFRRSLLLDYETSVHLLPDGSALLYLVREGLYRTGIGPQHEKLPSQFETIAVEDVGSRPNRQIILCGDASTGKLWRFDRTLRFFTEMPLPNGDRFVSGGRLPRSEAASGTLSQPTLLTQFFEREQNLQYVRGVAGTYALEDGNWVVLEVPESAPKLAEQMLAARTGDDPFVYAVTVVAHDGFAEFQHDFQPRTLMERLAAGYAMCWSLIYPPALQLVSSVSAAEGLHRGFLLDPLVASGRRTWLLVGCWLVALASVALLRRRLLRIGVAAPVRRFWLVLGIATMSGEPAFLDGLDAAMQNFRDTAGLIIDVRGNGGGTRDALRRLAPYFLPEGSEPIVGNIAAFLLEDEQPATPDALADRYLYRADWSGWTDPQRTAIGKFLRTFRPSWKLPAGKFSPWHFLVLDRDHNQAAYRYRNKVVVLIDRGCFSATDIFAAAMQAIPGVTLLGEATAGGSGRARSYQLPKSGIRLQLSSMASFRPDGTLLEGNGVVPDVPVAMQPGDLLGQTDTVLQKALELLK